MDSSVSIQEMVVLERNTARGRIAVRFATLTTFLPCFKPLKHKFYMGKNVLEGS